MRQETIVQTRDLTIGYHGTAVVSHIDLTVKRGRIVVVLGKSGCGKSTLLKTMIGLLPPIAGSVEFDGRPVDFSSEQSLQRLFGRIGVLYQSGALLNSLNLYENIALPITMHHPAISHEIRKEMVTNRLHQVGLAPELARYPAELSGGMRKRAALARAMILDPEIIFCDEPSAGLDPITAAGLDELMLNLKELLGITFVVVTHELRSIERIADDVLVMQQSRIRFNGSFQELKNTSDPFVRAFFLWGNANNKGISP
ncbi:MAG TPA: ATP-binding cassette domain-containing protein [Candidatus Aminicenantes bacterium]|nr:ATP-binding cassette domain-containing protein [Candidatus Aminicenantes bacterium]